MTDNQKRDRRLTGPRTWENIKKDIEDAGIKNTDVIWNLDLGPYNSKLIIVKDQLGIEITDDCSEILDNELK